MPLFVVGMPRSGTTLLEQMLTMHPFVAGAGEGPNLAVLAPRLFVDRKQGAKSATFDPSTTAADMDALAAKFLDSLEAHAGLAAPTGGAAAKAAARGSKGRVKYIVSKLPNHFELLGLVAKLFPGAPVLHATRDARDTILSNYQTSYQLGHRWSYNLTEATDYFAG